MFPCKDMENIGKYLVIAGMAITTLGLIFLAIHKVPFLGRLPGDLRFEGEGLNLYLPITTCILISLILTGIANLIFWIMRG